MSHRIAALAFALVIGLAGAARAAEARPPIGSWIGAFADGSTVELYLQADGSCMFGPTGQPPVVGAASWRTTSQVGGILTITYYNAGFQNHIYLSVVWTGAQTFTLSDPYFKVQMKRR